VTLCFLILVLSPFFYFIRSKLLTIALVFFALAFVVTIFVQSDAFQTVKNLMRLMLFAGEWGLLWWLLLPALAMLCVVSDLEQKKEYMFVIIAFLMLRIFLFVFYEGPEDSSWLHSGNRILLHITPFALFSLAVLIYDVWKNETTIMDSCENIIR
jgi:hypothetical protein